MNRRVRGLSFMIIGALILMTGIARAEDEHLYHAAMLYGYNGTEWKKVNTDANGNLTATFSGDVTLGSMGILSAAEARINPAKEDGNLATLVAKDFATQTTLALLEAKDFATQTTLAALNTKVTACNTGAVTISSSALPTGAATAAKQPALGTAGTASTDVITVQGIASMTPIKVDISATSANTTAIKVDNSAVTQPVSGSVTATDSVVSATLVHHAVDFTAGQTAQAVWTPASGKKFVITDMIISLTAAGTITVFDNTDSTANRVAKGYFTANGGLDHSCSKPFKSSTNDYVLKYTTDLTAAGSLVVWGYEE